MGVLQGAIQVLVTINGSSITISKENFINLKIKRHIGDTANSFTLEAFDETAYALENLLQKKKELAPISVQYCSARDITKKVTFSGTCMNYQISFIGKGTLISITGVFSGGTTESSKYWFERANIEWVGEARYDEDTQQWIVDGKGSKSKADGGNTDELYTDYINNENVCAVLEFKSGIPGSDVEYTNPDDGSEALSKANISNKNTTGSLFSNKSKSGQDLINSSNVESLRSRVTTRCQELGISAFLPVVMAILRQESGGRNPSDLPDMFQCSESLGKKPNSITLDESIEQGPKYFKECLDAANNKVEVALQAYNFGINFATWATLHHKNEPFIQRWCLDYKLKMGFSASFGDDKYVEHVKRFYRVKDIGEDLSTYSLKRNAKSVETEITPGDSTDTPTVYYNPARIFKRIMKVYSGKTGGSPIEKYTPYFNTGNVEDTQWVAGMRVIQENETAAEYITNVLCKYAMTVESGTAGNALYGKNYLIQSSGFKYYVDNRGHNFEHIDYNANAATAPTLTYGTDDSIIISFSTGNVGALAMTGNLYDEVTGRPNVDEATLDDISGDIFTIGGENVLGADTSEEDKEKSKLYQNWWEYQISPNQITSSDSASSFEKKIYSTWNELQNLTTTAEMTVWRRIRS